MKTAIIFGASGGIGREFVAYCLQRYDHVFACTRQSQTFETIEGEHQGALHLMQVNPTSERELKVFAQFLSGREFNVQLIVNACGVLHDKDGLAPEKKIEDFNVDNFEKSIRGNTIITPLIAKHFMHLLDKGAKNLNTIGVFASLSARVGSISDNYLGGWYSYRASKAALNQLIKTLSVEAGRRFKHSAVIAIHPGTTDTNLSKPFQENVPEGKLFTAEFAIGKMMSIIEGLTQDQSGKFYAWDGEEIEW